MKERQTPFYTEIVLGGDTVRVCYRSKGPGVTVYPAQLCIESEGGFGEYVNLTVEETDALIAALGRSKTVAQ